jgi:hypothetical protein
MLNPRAASSGITDAMMVFHDDNHHHNPKNEGTS